MLIYAGPGPLPLDPAIPNNRELQLHFICNGTISPKHLDMIRPLLMAFPEGRIDEEYWMLRWTTDGGGYGLVCISENGSANYWPYLLIPFKDVQKLGVEKTIAMVEKQKEAYGVYQNRSLQASTLATMM